MSSFVIIVVLSGFPQHSTETEGKEERNSFQFYRWKSFYLSLTISDFPHTLFHSQFSHRPIHNSSLFIYKLKSINRGFSENNSITRVFQLNIMNFLIDKYLEASCNKIIYTIVWQSSHQHNNFRKECCY